MRPAGERAAPVTTLLRTHIQRVTANVDRLRDSAAAIDLAAIELAVPGHSRAATRLADADRVVALAAADLETVLVGRVGAADRPDQDHSAGCPAEFGFRSCLPPCCLPCIRNGGLHTSLLKNDLL